MSFGQKDADKEWPTFNYEDVQVSYSPNDGENENDKIFTDFKPATEFHNIRNKKRKPKNARALRLISGTSYFITRKRSKVILCIYNIHFVKYTVKRNTTANLSGFVITIVLSPGFNFIHYSSIIILHCHQALILYIIVA